MQSGRALRAGGGGEVAWQLEGTGPDTVVVIHGGPGLQSRYLQPALRPLSSAHALLFYDQRGRGRSSPAVDSALGLDEDIADLEALRQAMGLQKLTIVAHHFGAMIAAGYALAHPDRVTRLVLISPFVPRQLFLFDLSLASVDSSRRFAYGRDRAGRMPEQDPAEFCHLYWDFLLSPAKVIDTTVVTELAASVCDAPPATLRDAERINHVVVSSLGAWDWRDTLAAVGAPVLVVQGGDDATLVFGARLWTYSLPDARLLVTDGSSLFPWVGADGAPLTDAVREFLAGRWPIGADSVAATEARSPGDDE